MCELQALWQDVVGSRIFSIVMWQEVEVIFCIMLVKGNKVNFQFPDFTV